MSRKKGQVFSAEQKTKIVLELLKEDQTVAQLATKYQITAKSIQNWKKQFLENAAIAFEPARAVSEFKNEIDELKKENDALARALGKVTVERDWAAGKLGDLDLSNKKDLVDSKFNAISMTRQCEMIGISRSSLYYKPKPMSEYEQFEKFISYLNLLKDGISLPPEAKNHNLKGDWKDFKECHLGGDMLLVYAKFDDEIILTRIGTHSEIFG